MYTVYISFVFYLFQRQFRLLVSFTCDCVCLLFFTLFLSIFTALSKIDTIVQDMRPPLSLRNWQIYEIVNPLPHRLKGARAVHALFRFLFDFNISW